MNSIVKFGDTCLRQISRTSMGIAPAPTWATIFYALHKHCILLSKWKSCLLFYKRFIDDTIGIWLPHPNHDIDSALWSALCRDLQLWHGLEWTVSPCTNECNFMDLTLTPTTAGTIETNLFEKNQNLYLYIPPGSAHPKAMINGLIFGNTLRIIRLCSHDDNATCHLSNFKTRLIVKGYSQELLDLIFVNAITHAKAFVSNSNPNPNHDSRNRCNPPVQDTSPKVFLHLKIHAAAWSSDYVGCG
eukprot:CCRYP_020575-RA/>CCRYP_020575-RA protein AED:0.51 eAED:0.51 QI:0/-1/0/1/-1/0/1/0/243